jgi:DNA-binding response OmpR family regulator
LKTTVLLVEDSKMQKLANERILSHAGYTVLCAVDGEQAVIVAREKLPDVVLLDILLPKLSGLQVLGILREHADTARIPVIILSTLPQVNEAKLKLAGAAGYFEKSRLLDDKNGEKIFLEMLDHIVKEARERTMAKATSA